MTERVAMVPAERLGPLIEAAGLPPAAATRTVYRVLANNPTVLNVVTAQIQTLIRKNSLPHRLRELVVDIANWLFASIVLRNLKIPIEDNVLAWPPDGVHPANAEE